MLNETQTREVIGSTAHDESGEKIGTVGQLFLDDQTGQPEFVTVNTGLFGLNESFVPVDAITVTGDRATVPYSKDKVKDAPKVDLDGRHLDETEEARLYEYYGLGGYADHMDHADHVIDTGHTNPEDHAATGDAATTGDDAMTRSEERVQVGTAEQEAGRVRLRKYVVTEQETHTVPVRKERAVLESEPITDANRGDATSGETITEDEHEVVLHEERPVVEKTAEPVERVRVGKETTVDEQTVTEDVRKEQVEVEGDTDHRA